MAASRTVAHVAPALNEHSLRPRHGVITLSGYGVSVRVDRGHLVFEDGVGPNRRRGRLARIGHELKRLIVIGADGAVSLAALRWLADQKAAFAMLDRDGRVLVVTGPVRPSDVRLRRAQGVAHHTETAVAIARDLIGRKLSEQRKVAEKVLRDQSAATAIGSYHEQVTAAIALDDIRRIEAYAAMAYWAAWRTVDVSFPRHQLARVPMHWRSFAARHSPLTGSPRLAVDPVNAILNYLYAVLETEARLAAAALGLDPGLGVLHADTIARDNLACDLMEPVRPLVDAYVLDWLAKQPLQREWFFETRSGNCRLVDQFADRLGQTAPTWARAVAPIAEGVAQAFWTKRGSRGRRDSLPSPLTQRHKRLAQGARPEPPIVALPKPLKVCQICGKDLRQGTHCVQCAPTVAREALVEAARAGRLISHSPASEAKRTATRLRNARAEAFWNEGEHPKWLTDAFYFETIRPRLMSLTNGAVRAALGVSVGYAARVRRGSVRPHRRHWLHLAILAGASYPESDGTHTPEEDTSD